MLGFTVAYQHLSDKGDSAAVFTGQMKSHRAFKWHLTPLSRKGKGERERSGTQTIKTFTPKSAALKENT